MFCLHSWVDYADFGNRDIRTLEKRKMTVQTYVTDTGTLLYIRHRPNGLGILSVFPMFDSKQTILQLRAETKLQLVIFIIYASVSYELLAEGAEVVSSY